MLQDALNAVTWACLTCLCVIVHRRVLRKPTVLKFALSTTFLTATIVSVLAAVVFFSDSWLRWHPELPSFGSTWVTSLAYNFTFALILACAAAALVLHERALYREERIGELRSSLTSSRLESIAARLNPHFLFNSLNSIAELVHLDPRMAERAILSLSSLLRSTLRVSQGHTAPLGEEVALARHYLRIERIRIGERLAYQILVDPETQLLQVPRMMLLPLVENAVTHGATTGDGRVELKVSAHRDGGSLSVHVWNSRSGPPSSHQGLGIGLASLSDRLELLHPGAARVSVTDNASGFTVDIRLPASQAPGGARQDFGE